MGGKFAGKLPITNSNDAPCLQVQVQNRMVFHNSHELHLVVIDGAARNAVLLRS